LIKRQPDLCRGDRNDRCGQGSWFNALEHVPSLLTINETRPLSQNQALGTHE
jgi:hypothetical protein